MPNNFTDSEERWHLDQLGRGTPHLALFTADPDESGTYVEVSGGGYARQALTGKLAAAGTVSGVSTLANSAAVTFPEATASWGTVLATGIIDAASGGTLRTRVPLTTGKTVSAGTVASFAAGDLTYTLE